MDNNKSITIDNLFGIAKKTLDELNSGEKFIVKDLFKGFEWNRIYIGHRTALGSKFFNFAKNDGCDMIDILGKSLQNQQIYSKK